MIEQASLIIGDGNWAIKSDGLLGYKINNGKYYPRDMTFTRATTGTRVNPQGFVEVTPYNLVSWSEQFENASWAKFGVSITANSTTSPSGIADADTFAADGTNTIHRAENSFNVTNATTYSWSVYAKKNTNNFIQLSGTDGGFGSVVFANFDLNSGVVGSVGAGTTASIQSVGNGWYRCAVNMTSIVTATVTAQIIVVTSATAVRKETNTLTTSVFLWGAQLVEGTEPLDYLPTTDRLDIARIDYSTGEPALLLEPQRTNLLLRSQEFDNASWAKQNATITANNTTSPDGTLNADKLVENTANAVHQINVNTSIVGNDYSFSVFVKKAERKYVSLVFSDLVRYLSQYTFDLEDGVLTDSYDYSGVTSTFVSEDYGNGWYRLTLSSNYASWSGAIYSRFYIENTSTPSTVPSNTYTGDGTSGVYIWGAQLEAGAYATSYIPTTSATVTRNADVCLKTGISSLIGQTEGTIYLEADIQKHNAQEFYIAISNGFSFHEAIYIYQPSGILQVLFRSGGLTFTISVSNANWNIGFNKIAIAYNTTLGEVFMNGVSKGTVALSALTALPTCSQFTLGSRPSQPGSLAGSGGYKAAALWKERLSDDECIQLTTL